MTREQAVEQTLNKSAKEITDLYNNVQDITLLFRESCRSYISRNIKDATEENPYKCGKYGWIIDDEELFGLSTLQYPSLISIFSSQDGILYFNFDGSTNPIEFDDMTDYYLMQIVNRIETLE